MVPTAGPKRRQHKDQGEDTNAFGLEEHDLNEIMEYFQKYRMKRPPLGVSKEDLPVTVTSLYKLFEEMGFSMTESEFLDIVYKLDPEKKGYVVLVTFLENVAKELVERSRVTPENAREIFNMLDRDGDRMVSLGDLKETLKILGEELPAYFIKDMLKEMDMDGDDMINYDEFFYYATGTVE